MPGKMHLTIPGAENDMYPQVRSSTPLNDRNDDSFIDDYVSSHATVVEDDMWNCKLILAALEEVVFGPLNPKIPEKIVQLLKGKLLDLKGDLAVANPFETRGEVGFLRQAQDCNYADDNKHQQIKSSLMSSSEVQNLPSQQKNINKKFYQDSNLNIPSDTKIVLRNSVGTQLKKFAKDIIHIYTPLLDNQSSLPDNASEEDIWERLVKVNQFLENEEVKFQEVSEKNETCRKENSRKWKALKTEVQEYESTVEKLDQLVNDENNEASYIEFLRLSKEEAELNLKCNRLEELIKSNPPDLTKEIQENYDSLVKATEELEKSCQEKETLINQYEELGPKFDDIRTELVELEVDIKMKLWVLEQLGTADMSFESVF